MFNGCNIIRYHLSIISDVTINTIKHHQCLYINILILSSLLLQHSKAPRLYPVSKIGSFGFAAA